MSDKETTGGKPKKPKATKPKSKPKATKPKAKPKKK